MNLGIKSKPCWLDDLLFPAVITDFMINDGYIYFYVEGRPLHYRVPIDHPGMPRHVYAPDGWDLPISDYPRTKVSAKVLIGEMVRWGFEIYWLVFDIDWFNSLPIEHDGLGRNKCDLCLKQWPKHPALGVDIHSAQQPSIAKAKREVERRKFKNG